MTTKQELFDKVCEGLASQNWEQCYYEYCRYEYEGKRCAIGHLIDKDEFKKQYEQELCEVIGTINGNQRINKYVCEKYGEEHIDFLAELQRVHDNSTDKNMKSKHREFAELHGLDTTTLDEGVDG